MKMNAPQTSVSCSEFCSVFHLIVFNVNLPNISHFRHSLLPPILAESHITGNTNLILSNIVSASLVHTGCGSVRFNIHYHIFYNLLR